jgi:pimeloyl-ACP methyl ester carboxylesterase
MTLHFQEYGSGHPLIILHGLFGSLDNWHTLSKILGGSFRVFAVDQRNHGRSPHSDIFTYEALAEDLREFLDEHRLKSAHVLGHSLGGKTAMQFALTFSDRVDKLIVVDIAPRAYPPVHDEIFDAMLPLDLRRYSSRGPVDEAMATKIPDVATRQFLMKDLSRDASGGFRWKVNLEAIRKNYDEVTRAIESDRTFTKPTLFVRGRRTGYVLDSDLPGIRKLFPCAEIADLDTGHWVHAEAPHEFSRLVLEFLQKKFKEQGE